MLTMLHSSLRSGWMQVRVSAKFNMNSLHQDASKKTNCFSNAHQISELMKMSKLNGCSTIPLSASFLYLHRSSWRVEFWVAFSRILKYVCTAIGLYHTIHHNHIFLCLMAGEYFPVCSTLLNIESRPNQIKSFQKHIFCFRHFTFHHLRDFLLLFTCLCVIVMRSHSIYRSIFTSWRSVEVVHMLHMAFLFTEIIHLIFLMHEIQLPKNHKNLQVTCKQFMSLFHFCTSCEDIEFSLLSYFKKNFLQKEPEEKTVEGTKWKRNKQIHINIKFTHMCVFLFVLVFVYVIAMVSYSFCIIFAFVAFVNSWLS